MRSDADPMMFCDPDPKTFSKEWNGFQQSKDKINDRYRAKCNYCGVIMGGRPEPLGKHKIMECKTFPEELKTLSKKRCLDKVLEGQDLSKTLPDEPKSIEMTLPLATQQIAAVFLTNGMIGGSVQFLFVENENMKELFKLLGFPKLCNRKYLSDEIAPQIYDQIHNNQLTLLVNAFDITIITDGWTDVSKIIKMAVGLKLKTKEP